MHAPASVVALLTAFLDALQAGNPERIVRWCSPTVLLHVRGLVLHGAYDVAGFLTSDAARLESASSPEVFAWDGEDLVLFDVEAVPRGSTRKTLFACAFALSDGRITSMTTDIRAIRPAVHDYPS